MIDVIPFFFNEPQDAHHYLDNASLMSVDNGPYYQIAPSDNTFQWEWYLRELNGENMTETLLGTDYNLNLDEVISMVGKGEKVILLRVKHVPTGFLYDQTIPTIINLSDINPNNSVGWDDLPYDYFPMPFSGILSFSQWAQMTVQTIQFTPRWKSKYFVRGRTGDLDLNGVVNITDVLLQSSNFGQGD